MRGFGAGSHGYQPSKDAEVWWVPKYLEELGRGIRGNHSRTPSTEKHRNITKIGGEKKKLLSLPVPAPAPGWDAN